MRHGVLAGCVVWLALVALGTGCGDDEDDDPAGEECFQAGSLDDRCRCADNQPMGIRRCLDNLVWSACVCPEPYDEPCERGEVVRCTCPGSDEVHTTECLGGGTYDCPCDNGGASGNGD